jgi:hypothetical protein
MAAASMAQQNKTKTIAAVMHVPSTAGTTIQSPFLESFLTFMLPF